MLLCCSSLSALVLQADENRAVTRIYNVIETAANIVNVSLYNIIIIWASVLLSVTFRTEVSGQQSASLTDIIILYMICSIHDHSTVFGIHIYLP